MYKQVTYQNQGQSKIYKISNSIYLYYHFSTGLKLILFFREPNLQVLKFPYQQPDLNRETMKK